MAKAIEKIVSMVSSLVSAARKPIETVPAFLIMSGAITRPGLSPMVLTSNIMNRFAEAGCYSGPLKDGSPNRMEIMERIRAEEYIKALKFDSRVQVAIAPGAIQITGTGANAGGPVVVQGMNTNAVHGDGIIG